MTMIEGEELCKKCLHPFPPHQLKMFAKANEDGKPALDDFDTMHGLILCPVEKCACISTWSVMGQTRPSIEEVTELLAKEAELRGEPIDWITEMLFNLYASEDPT